jgi:hypothetical protein
MNRIQEAKRLFQVPKPAHFTNYQHCCECAEHDETLMTANVDSIGLQQLGNPGWDPLCFTSAEGLLYYMLALIRLTLDILDKPQERYLYQMLFHLIRAGKDNDLVRACSQEQRAFVAKADSADKAVMEMSLDWLEVNGQRPQAFSMLAALVKVNQIM